MHAPAQPFLALLSIGEALAGNRRPGLSLVAGRTLVERQARQALRAGAAAILLVAPALPDDVARRLRALGRVHILATGAALAAELHARTGALLLFEPGVVADERIVEAIANSAAALVVAAFDANPPATAERLGPEHHWASVSRMPAAAAVAELASHPDWEPIGMLNRVALAHGADLFPVGAIDLYSEGRRRSVPLVWERVVTEADARRAETAILLAAQKGCLDWPARFLHPPVENALVRLLWPTAVTPNMVTILTAIIGIVAFALLAAGILWPGLLLILAVGPLDGVDGKLARTRIEFSRWGDLEHVMDKILEYSWFLALGSWFAGTGHGLAAWLVALGLILFALLEAVQGEWFRRLTGRQLDDWGVFERRVRLVAGRRNTFFWALVPFGLAGAWWQGFLFLLAYAGATFAVAEWRFLKRLAEFTSQEAPAVRRNLLQTRYAFLPGPDRKSS